MLTESATMDENAAEMCYRSRGTVKRVEIGPLLVQRARMLVGSWHPTAPPVVAFLREEHAQEIRDQPGAPLGRLPILISQ